jgi:protein MpaA
MSLAGLDRPWEDPRVPLAAPPPVVFGHSVAGHALVAARIGDPAAPRKMLVVGSIHGEEPAGTAVVRALRRRRPPPGVELWLVRTVNPDGLRAGRRSNDHGVDLNRNFARGWRAASGATSGPRPFSEPESRAVRRLVLRVRPAVTVWLHQPWGQVLAPCSGPAPLEARYARLARLPLRRCRGARLPGTATRWQNAAVPGSHAFVVELRPGAPGRTAVARHVRALTAIARG